MTEDEEQGKNNDRLDTQGVAIMPRTRLHIRDGNSALEIAQATRCSGKGARHAILGRRDAVRQKDVGRGWLEGVRRRDKMTVCKRSRGSGNPRYVDKDAHD